jgi:hypothetical protein
MSKVPYLFSFMNSKLFCQNGGTLLRSPPRDPPELPRGVRVISILVGRFALARHSVRDRGTHDLSVVMPGLVPGTHAFAQQSKAWMAGTSPAKTNWRFHVIGTCSKANPPYAGIVSPQGCGPNGYSLKIQAGNRVPRLWLSDSRARFAGRPGVLRSLRSP